MLEFRKYKRDMDFSEYDYVFEDTEKFEELLPFLLPKLDGEWRILLVEVKLQYIRKYLDTAVIPSYLQVTCALEASQLEQLYLERPVLEEKELSNWDIYLGLLKGFSVYMTDKAMRELYFRAGPGEAKLKEALSLLSTYQSVTMREINKHFAPVNRVYTKQVMRSFLFREYKKAWSMLKTLELEIGSTVAFYAMRKVIRKLFLEKSRYLRNEDITDKTVEKIDSYTIVLMYWLFETATSPLQLYPILQMFERRQVPC